MGPPPRLLRFLRRWWRAGGSRASGRRGRSTPFPLPWWPAGVDRVDDCHQPPAKVPAMGREGVDIEVEDLGERVRDVEALRRRKRR